MKSNIEKIVCKYIEDQVCIESIDYDMDIFEEGLVNSLFAIELMTFLEKTFEVKITMDDLDMANFKSVNCITEFVRKKYRQVKSYDGFIGQSTTSSI